MQTHKRLILLGSPASGKGTQARFLSELFEVPTLSTGSMLRREIEAETELGKKAQEFMDAGHFVPDEVVNAMVQKWIKRLKDKSFLLDGYPRTVAQAETLQKFLVEEGCPLDCAVWMDVSKEVILGRLSGRIECNACGYVTQGEVGSDCPNCNRKHTMQARKDDQIDRFEVRWADFQAKTVPVIDYYLSLGDVVRVQVHEERDRDEVSTELRQKLEDYFAN